MAYLARHFLKQLGYQPNDVVGVFFVPPAGAGARPNRVFELGNAYAALKELNHFSTSGVTFAARYETKGPLLTDSDAPYSRCQLLPQEDFEEETQQETAAGQATSFILRDLLTPLGRVADAYREGLLHGRCGPELPGAKRMPVIQTFGMYRLSWPRRVLLERAARRLGQRLVDHWLAKETAPFRAELQAWARAQFAERGLEADQLILNLRTAGERTLKQEPEDAFDAIVARVRKGDPIPDPHLVSEVLEELEPLVGRPEGHTPLPQRPVLIESLDQAAHALLQSCEQKLAEMTVQLVEQPRFRFAGAEESIRQISAVIEEVLARQEPLCEEFFTKANAAYHRIVTLVEALKSMPPGGRRKPPEEAVHLASLLRLYPMVRFQALVMLRVLNVYRSLHGNCPEYQREFTYCRTRLGDLQKSLARPFAAAPALDLGHGRHLLPVGCHSIDDAITQLLGNVSAADIIALDQHIQDEVILKRFQALVHVCTTPATSILRDVETAMQQDLEEEVKKRLGTSNVLDTFLSQMHKEAGAITEISTAFDQATPRLAGALPLDQEAATVVVPSDPSADQFQQLVKKALPEATVIVGPRGDDVVFYRERLIVSLAQLPQLGDEARLAYEKINAAEHCTAHCRTDVVDWRQVVG
jgi:hypothetical protein